MNRFFGRLAEIFKGRSKDVLILAVVGFGLLVAVWSVFQPTQTENSVATMNFSGEEDRLGYILSQMEGVGEAEVIICELADGEKGAVVLCEGANNFQVVINVREVVAAAIGTNAQNVKIYLKK